MCQPLRHALGIILSLGYFGPLVLGILDSSFLFMPFGNDLLIVGLTVRHHDQYLQIGAYIAMAAIGSVLGVLLIHAVAHKGGEEGITHFVSEKRFEYLKRKIDHYGGTSPWSWVAWRLRHLPSLCCGRRQRARLPPYQVVLPDSERPNRAFQHRRPALAIVFGHRILDIAKSPVFFGA